jgi:hypothetical protein
MSDKTYVLDAANYASKADAKTELEALKAIESAGAIRDLTALIVSKNEKSHLDVHQTTHAGKVAAAIGAVAGAIGQFAGVTSRKDMKEPGEFLDAGEPTDKGDVSTTVPDPAPMNPRGIGMDIHQTWGKPA